MAEPAAEVPPTHNPEALEDAKPAAAGQQFQNVDLEANNAAAAPATATTAPAGKTKFTELAESTDYGVLNLALAFASIVVMIASSTICGGTAEIVLVGGFVSCTGIQGFQVAVSTISAFIAIFTWIAYSGGALGSEAVQQAISGFQFLWWTAGMIVLTFFGNYQSVLYANGYFGTWIAYALAAMGLIHCSPMFRRSVDNFGNSLRSPLLYLVVASAVVMGAAIGPCSPQAACYRYNAWALSMGTISLGISSILLLAAPMIPESAMKAVAVFFVIWWSVGFCVSTFGGPFETPGNGYFASLAAVVASINLLRLTTQPK